MGLAHGLREGDGSCLVGWLLFVQVRVAAFHEHCDAVSGCYKDVLVQVDGTQTKDKVRRRHD